MSRLLVGRRLFITFDMAQRRMFSKRITNSGRFLKMPTSSQALYFHLGMEADDDGVVEAFNVMRTVGFNEDDIKVLAAKGFVRVLNEDMVSFITDWREHNLIRSDRKVDSIYKDLLLQLVPDTDVLTPKPRADTGSLPGGRPVDYQRTAQVRLGKDRKGKERLGKVTEDTAQSADVAEIINLFKVVNPSYTRLFAMPPQRAAVSRLLKTHGREKLTSMVNFLPRSNNMEYVPIITTPCQLEDKMGQLVAALQKVKNKTPILL